MTVAERMRRYRSKRALVRALDLASDRGVDVAAVWSSWSDRRGVTEIGVTPLATLDLFDRNGDRRYGGADG